MSADPPVILTDVTDRIGTITLNRPERRNALNGALIEALDAAVSSMAADDGAKVVVLTGAAPADGLGGFCAGGDVKEGATVLRPDGTRHPTDAGVPRGALDGDLSRHDRHAAMQLHLMPKPTVAMIGGPAVGAGLSLAAACDLRVASHDAVFAASFTPNGLSGDYGGTFFLTSILGTARTRQLYLLNDKISAQTALEWGLVHAVVSPRELVEYTTDLARRLVRTPSSVLALVKDNLNQAEDETQRRRFLFANEASNQELAGANLAARLRAKAPDSTQSTG